MAKTVDELLSEARALLPYRPSPAEALAAQADCALLVDIGGDDQRRAGCGAAQGAQLNRPALPGAVAGRGLGLTGQPSDSQRATMEGEFR